MKPASILSETDARSGASHLEPSQLCDGARQRHSQNGPVNSLDRSTCAEMFARYYLHLAGVGRWVDLVDRGRLLYSAHRHLNPMTVAATESRHDVVTHARPPRGLATVNRRAR